MKNIRNYISSSQINPSVNSALFSVITTLLLLLVFGTSNNVLGQASLPLSRTVWNAGEPTGWTNSGSTARTTSFACTGNNGAQFDASNVRRTVFFNAAPDEVTFKLKKASMSASSTMLVERSDNGTSWTTIGTYTGTSTASSPNYIDNCADITIALTAATRYVRWTYTKNGGNCDMDDVSITAASVSAPEIDLFQGATPIASGSGSYSFGSIAVSASSSAVTFTIENNGNASLSLSGSPRVAISGNTGDFTIVQTSTAATVAASASTTFTITFNPTTTGARSATISIVNNDSNENPYTFSVTGTGVGATISTSAISGSPFCVGNSITAAVNVPYTITGTFNSGNVFTAQLSNSSGSFASPTNIGTVSSTSAGTISATIPASVGAGGAYRIRVVGSNPSTTGGNNGSNLTVQNFAGPTATAASCGNANADVSWSNPGCFDQIMVVAKASAFGSALPTGNGSAYTANLAFGSGTGFDGGFVVYKGTGTASGTITGLTNGTTYHFKTFARRGTVWIVGGTDNCAPVAGPCFTEDFESGLPTSYTSTTSFSLSSGTWTGSANQIFRGTSGVTSGSYSLQLRSQTGAQLTSPNISTGIDVLTFYASSSTGSGAFQVNISTNNGASFSAAPGSPFTSVSGSPTLYTIAINDPAVTNIQFYRTNATIYIDEVAWTCPPACTPPTNPTGTISGTTPACGSTSLNFSGSASSPVVNYWQTSATGTATTDNAASGLSVSSSGNYYVRAYNSSTNCWSAGAVGPYAVTINANASITNQPTSQSINTGDNTTFTATATNAGSYQWQVDTGSGFGNITNGGVYSGATTATLSITSATLAMNGYQYRVVIGNSTPCTGSLNSNAGTLTVINAIAITDNGCEDNDYTELTFNVASNLVITDVNVGVKATTTWRGDLIVKLVSPQGTEITLLNNVGGGADNLDVLFDDSGTANALSSGNHTVDGTYDITAQVQGALTLPLSTFNGELSQGDWTIRICDDAALDLAYLNAFEVLITGTTPCTPTASITSFAPTTGPVGTVVTITGTGFTGATNVQFGNVNAASFTVVNATTITAEVPANAPTGKVRVFDAASCAAASAANFTVIGQSGTCGSGAIATDLFISEVFDATTGDYHIVEIFNGTAGTITLTGVYTVRIIAYGNNGSNTADIPLTGSIASGATFLLRIGTSTGACSFTPNQTNNTGGFNGNDEVMLRKNGVTIDFTENPNQGAGFSQVRKASVTSPSNSYVASQWDITQTESCANIGTSPYAAGTELTITTQPTDAAGCEISLTVAATASAGITYQWKYNDGVAAGWTDVTTFTGTTVTGATGATLTITGSVNALSGYQFYNQVSAGTCQEASNAVQFTFGVLPVFRSKASGNWNNIATWEMANTTAGPWSDACDYPTAANSTEVIVLNSHKVTLNLDLSIDKLTIDAGGEVEILPSAELTILNGQAGADLFVNGTLTDRGNSTHGLEFEDNTSTANDASWTLGNNGIIIKTNTSSVVNYRDFYQGGISNIPATANWYYRYNGDGNPSTATADMYYPNLHFENTANTGNFAWDNFSMILNGRLTTATIKGDLNIGVSGTGTVTVLNNNINSQPITILGDLYVELGSTLTNQADPSLSAANYGISGGGTGTYGHGTGFEVHGAVYVEGTLDVNTSSIGLLRFAGTGTQDVLGAGTLDLWNVEKTASGSVVLDRAIVVNNNISFSAGTFNADGNNITVGGIWDNTGATYTHGNNTVILNGSGNSTVRSNGQHFYNVEVATTGSGIVYPVTDDLDIDNLLEVSQGAFEVPSSRTVNTDSFSQTVLGNTTLKANGVLNVD